MAKLTGLLARLDPRNCVFSGGQISPGKGNIFMGYPLCNVDFHQNSLTTCCYDLSYFGSALTLFGMGRIVIHDVISVSQKYTSSSLFYLLSNTTVSTSTSIQLRRAGQPVFC